MAIAKKLPSGNWRAQVYAGKDETGKRLYESFTAPTKREAERDAAVFSADRRRARRDRSARRVTLAQAFDDHIESCRLAGMSPATVSGYLAIARNAFPSLLPRYVDEITVPDIQREINRRAATHSPKSIKNEFFLLRPVLKKYAPALDLSSILLPRGRRPEMVIPDDDGVRRLLDQARRTDADLYLAILLASTLGLRRSEICALEWSDIDETTHLLTVNKALVRDSFGVFVLKPPKTRAGNRCLFIADAAYEAILRYRSTGRIVRLNPNQLTARYEALRDALHVPGRFHDLRHYMASVMAALGVPENYAVEIMGHATRDMLQRVYQHTMEKKRAHVNAQINRHTDALLHGDLIDYATQNTTRPETNPDIPSFFR